PDLFTAGDLLRFVVAALDQQIRQVIAPGYSEELDEWRALADGEKRDTVYSNHACFTLSSTRSGRAAGIPLPGSCRPC
ncbi:hypothetical protein Q6265_29435, partial [Klebsiella pneumoniae]